MKKIILIDITIIFVVGLSSYLSTDNLYLMCGVILIFSLYLFIVFNRMYKKQLSNVNRYHECFHFMNDYIVSLNTNQSLLGAFVAIQNNFSKELDKEIEGVKDTDIVQKIEYLQGYFPFHVYFLFCQIIKIYDKQGGNILNMSSYLIKQARSVEEYIDTTEKYRSQKIIEIIILWSCCLLILIFIRFGLNQFFNTIKTNLIYVIFIGVFYLFLLIFIHMSGLVLFKFDVRGFAKNEKN